MKTSALFLGMFLAPLAPSGLGAQQLLWRCMDDGPELALVTDRQFASEPRIITWKFTPIGGGAGFKSEDDSTQAIWRPSDDSLALIARPEMGQFAIQALGASHVTLRTTGRTYGFRIHGVMLGLGTLGCVEKTFELAGAPDERPTSQDGLRNQIALPRLEAQAQSEEMQQLVDAGINRLCIAVKAADGVAWQARIGGISYEAASVGVLSSMRLSGIDPESINSAFCGEMRIGWTWALAHVSWGPPDRKSTTTTTADTVETWYYDNGNSLIIVNGIVETITKVEREKPEDLPGDPTPLTPC